jgi:hypothetical protein
MEQGITTHTSASDSVVMRTGSSQVREVAIGETLTVGSGGTITCDGGTVSGNTVTFAVPGRFTVTHAGGKFAVLAYEPAALDLVPLTQTSGAIGVTRSEHDRRLVLRALATHSTCDGTALDLTHLPLQRFGA